MMTRVPFQRGAFMATFLHVTSAASGGESSTFLPRGDIQETVDLDLEGKGDFQVDGSNFVMIPDAKSVIADGEKKRGSFTKIATWSDGKASDCVSIGCFWPRQFLEGGAGGLEVCQAQCYKTKGCDVVDFCPKGSKGECDEDEPTPENPMGNGISRCCMRTCTNGHSDLDNHWHGWDVYELPLVGDAAKKEEEQQAGDDAAVSTALTEASKAGDTELHVKTTSGFTVGDVIEINGEKHRITAFGSLILETPLEKDHPAGTVIKVMTADKEEEKLLQLPRRRLPRNRHPRQWRRLSIAMRDRPTGRRSGRRTVKRSSPIAAPRSISSPRRMQSSLLCRRPL
eukprot:TRINITY_DN1316_c0_g3_i1.p1 TRINITY_DN1316_c0_g3~~TRINITY_DN1316_c0_g3_i1.p1  ORF type:complete len:340 (-),score=47.61 TRINITY_DN1316_c0_g3_i1:98-1117(-)